jgi:ABC-type sugar transport system permease subunit
MSDHLHIDTPTRSGTIGGTFIAILLNIFSNDIIRTIGFAAIGATVSFFVSLGWKWLLNKYKSKKDRPRSERQG